VDYQPITEVNDTIVSLLEWDSIPYIVFLDCRFSR